MAIKYVAGKKKGMAGVVLMVLLSVMLCKKGNNILVKNVLCENTVIGFLF
jgi:hypothetical protein